MCLHFVLCFVAQERLGDLVLANPVFQQSARGKCVKTRWWWLFHVHVLIALSASHRRLGGRVNSIRAYLQALSMGLLCLFLCESKYSYIYISIITIGFSALRKKLLVSALGVVIFMKIYPVFLNLTQTTLWDILM